jgi:hypothetical protein
VALGLAREGESLAQSSSPGNTNTATRITGSSATASASLTNQGGPAFRDRCRFRRIIAISSGLIDSSAKRMAGGTPRAFGPSGNRRRGSSTRWRSVACLDLIIKSAFWMADVEVHKNVVRRLVEQSIIAWDSFVFDESFMG